MKKKITELFIINLFFIFLFSVVFSSNLIGAEPTNPHFTVRVQGKIYHYPTICRTSGYTCILKSNGSFKYWCYTTTRARSFAQRNSNMGRPFRCIQKIIIFSDPEE